MKYWYLVGENIGHSRSPGLWNGAFSALGVSVEYQLLDVRQDELDRALEKLRQPQVIGANITMPHKDWAYRTADERDDWASLAKTANVLYSRGTDLVASNTDIRGIIAILRSHPELERVLIVGAGGVARATLGACQHLGITNVALACRKPAAYEKLQRECEDFPVSYVPWSEVGTSAEQADLIVNATSLGMGINPGNPLPEFTPKKTLRILDAVYRNEPTELERWCQDRGVPYASGLQFLYSQAVSLADFFASDGVQSEEILKHLRKGLDNDLSTWR